MSTYPRPTIVTIDGLDLNGVHPDGTEWRHIEVKGWHDHAVLDVPQIQRTTSIGQFPRRGRQVGRVPILRGQILGAREGVADAIQRLNSVLADGEFGQLLIGDRTLGSRTATVQLLALDVIWAGGTTAQYVLTLLAPDPLKYGSTSTDSTPFASDPSGVGLVFPLFPDAVLDFDNADATSIGVLSLSNPGTATAYPVFTVSGPAPAAGLSITDLSTGQRIRYYGDLPSGSELVIDSSAGSVVINGTADRLGDTVIDAWPSIPAGSTREYLFASLGTFTAAELAAEAEAAYW